ncbi:hypothetical protein MKZ38_001893 [Zalerion maritima]|uniref:Uncharacterized protein n=1 Tax=Zalerion maritima TaxID=339359 RepID=A0AAD5RQZ2_9PEZI|nr:hypothetical protein MKZ38_001893 [Zalerion maritima]
MEPDDSISASRAARLKSKPRQARRRLPTQARAFLQDHINDAEDCESYVSLLGTLGGLLAGDAERENVVEDFLEHNENLCVLWERHVETFPPPPPPPPPPRGDSAVEGQGGGEWVERRGGGGGGRTQGIDEPFRIWRGLLLVLQELLLVKDLGNKRWGESVKEVGRLRELLDLTVGRVLGVPGRGEEKEKVELLVERIMRYLGGEWFSDLSRWVQISLHWGELEMEMESGMQMDMGEEEDSISMGRRNYGYMLPATARFCSIELEKIIGEIEEDEIFCFSDLSSEPGDARGEDHEVKRLKKWEHVDMVVADQDWCKLSFDGGDLRYPVCRAIYELWHQRREDMGFISIPAS